MNRLSLTPPSDYLLSRDVCSYGYFLLAPNRWDPGTGTFWTVTELEGAGGGGGAVRVTISQRAGPGSTLNVRLDRQISHLEAAALKARLVRMLRLDELAEHIAEFHALDPRFRESGRGRVMRSPTLFEDVIKTVTSCNVAWPSTIIMNRRLCETVGKACASDSPGGRHAFPTPEAMARVRPLSLRARCSVGYRDARIVQLAKMFVRGEIDPAWLENAATSDDEIHEALLEWPGIGPYAAANIMQLLGRYARLPLDSESVRHGRDVLGFKGSPAQIMKRVKNHFEPFGPHRFRSYWFELWTFYERKRGPAWTWVRETTGKTFTASKLKDADFAAEVPPKDVPSVRAERRPPARTRARKAKPKRRSS